MRTRTYRRMALILASTLACVIALGADARAQFTETTLYSFKGSPDGYQPLAGLVMDASGNLYGTTSGGGAFNIGIVFELANSSEGYTEDVLYSFGEVAGDGAAPLAGLIMDASGNLYGTTENGGLFNTGTVFKVGDFRGTYVEQVLYPFTGSSGTLPVAGLIMDASGNLYGTTEAGGASNAGTVFELVNYYGTYPTEKVLYSFAGSSSGDGSEPLAGLTMDASGNLYGTTLFGGPSGNGTVFELVNSNGTYTEKVLYSFGGSPSDGAFPYANLIIDASGNLYGTTAEGGAYSNAGIVFELVNSSQGYTEEVLYSFGEVAGDGAFPSASLIMDASGNLYGTTEGGGASGTGTVFELVNSNGTYTEKVLYSFAGSGTVPVAGLVMDSHGNLYGTASGGGTSGGFVFELASCQQTGTTTTLTSSPNPATAGNSINLTATVTSACGVPTGSVQFFNGAASLGTLTLSSGTATLAIEDAESLGVGTYTITAQYTPASGSGLSPSSGSVSQTVNEPGVAVTGSGNTFTGNQTVAGSLTATSLIGSGAGLTNLNPANLSGGTAGINITGNAATATTAATATSAATATALAGPTTQCGTNLFSIGISTSGNANCAQPASTNLSDYSTLVLDNQANTFAGGKQTLAPSAAGYASLNLPNTGAVPSTPVIGDLWLTNADAHPKFQDRTNTTQSVAFLSDVSSAGSGLLTSNNSFTGSNTFSQTIIGSISGNAATATSAVTATTATTATTALTATTASNATTAGALAATPTQCGASQFATGIAANGNANCAPPPTGIGASQILFSSAGIPVWNGAFMGISAPSLTEASVEQIVAVGGHITAMQCYTQTAPKGSSETLTLRQNGASSVAVCTIAVGKTGGSVTGLNLSLAAGNLLDVKVGGPSTLGAATVAVAVGP